MGCGIVVSAPARCMRYTGAVAREKILTTHLDLNDRSKSDDFHPGRKMKKI
jgi:hypothetical protein